MLDAAEIDVLEKTSRVDTSTEQQFVLQLLASRRLAMRIIRLAPAEDRRRLLHRLRAATVHDYTPVYVPRIPLHSYWDRFEAGARELRWA
jgi:hypothetical protein